MNVSNLTAIGLTENQAKAYLTLVQYGSLTPPDLADKIGEPRTNAYKILEQLEKLGLVRKDESARKLSYRPNSPIALEELAKKHRDEILEREKQIKLAMPNLMNFFYTYSEQPGVRFFQGKDGIQQIFDDMLRTRQDIYLVRSPADRTFFDDQLYITKFKKRRAKLGINTYALTTDIPSAEHNPEVDKSFLVSRTWINKKDYTASVEWNAYGNKLAIISYGEEAIGMIIESPMIAESFRQLFALMRGASGRDA